MLKRKSDNSNGEDMILMSNKFNIYSYKNQSSQMC